MPTAPRVGPGGTDHPFDLDDHDWAAIERSEIRQRLDAVEAQLAELTTRVSRRRRSDQPQPGTPAMAANIEMLAEALIAYGDLAFARAQPMFWPKVVAEALRTKAIWSYIYPGQPRMLTALKPDDRILRDLGAAVADGPARTATLRKVFGPNTATIIDDAVEAGLLRRGTLKMGKAGRPQTIVARADQPLPIFYDEWKVEWR